MFASTRQLELLTLAKYGYVDRTFRMVRVPVTQLFSIHAFVRSRENMKLVPLVFVVIRGPL